MCVHNVLDAISLEIGKQVADRVEANPELVDIARANLVRWKARNVDAPSLMRCYAEWENILAQPLSRTLKILRSRDDESQRLRQNSPFVGILSPAEVRELKKKIRDREAATA